METTGDVQDHTDNIWILVNINDKSDSTDKVLIKWIVNGADTVNVN